MTINKELQLHMIHSDPRSVDSPILDHITNELSNIVIELLGEDSHLEILLAYAISELMVVNSQMIYCGENSIQKVIDCLKEILAEFDKKELNNFSTVIEDCISSLSSILVNSDELYPNPNDSESELSALRFSNIDYKNKFSKRILNVKAKCPSCSHEFIASSYNVSRNPYGYKCPNCNQLILY